MQSFCMLRRVGSALRPLVLVGSALVLAACSQTFATPATPPPAAAKRVAAAPTYEALPAERFPVAAVPADELDPRYVRQRVRYETRHQPGTIVVDPDAKFLYLVQEGGYAMRYGVGVGREGFGWTGTASIERKAQWPTWTPPAEMIKREPELAQYAKGMKGGIDNPLGARALYLFQNGRDTLYRLHGTNDPTSIGQDVSSGCIRLLNHDVIDLYQRVPTGSKVVVLPHGSQVPAGASAGI